MITLYNTKRSSIKKSLSKEAIMKKAFTLIELLIVILILGILVVIALPRFQKAVQEARYSESHITMSAIRTSQEAYYLEYMQYSDDISNLTLDLPPADKRNFFYSTDTDTPPGIPNNAYIIVAHPDSIKPGMDLIEGHPHIHADHKIGLWRSASKPHSHGDYTHTHDISLGNPF